MVGRNIHVYKCLHPFSAPEMTAAIAIPAANGRSVPFGRVGSLRIKQRIAQPLVVARAGEKTLG
ncbi:MAG: hypothetical protein JWN74_1885 [Acidobacteriaceae bacterium]|nr:hypothetical protein [Acidobacteriaceae bacterium]